MLNASLHHCMHTVPQAELHFICKCGSQICKEGKNNKNFEHRETAETFDRLHE